MSSRLLSSSSSCRRCRISTTSRLVSIPDTCYIGLCNCEVYVCMYVVSCHAVTDVLRGGSLDDIVEDMPAVWETCFRVRDDIKVRHDDN